MLVPFLIMLREGIEAALIVGIVASYLAQTGRSAWMLAVWIGIFLAVALSLFVGTGLQMISAEFPQKAQECFEAVVGCIAAAVLTSMVFWMRKVSRSIAAELRASIDTALTSTKSQGYALVAMIFFAVAREGLESVFFLLATFQQSESAAAPLGALLGLVCAVAIGYAIYTGGVRLNLKRFFRWTGVFILIVAAGILAQSLRAFHEAGLWNHFQAVVVDLSAVLPVDGAWGTVLSGMFGYQDLPTQSEVFVYVVFLAMTLYLFLRPHRQKPSSSYTPASNEQGITPSDGSALAGTQRTLARVYLVLSVLLVVVAMAAFYFATRFAHREHARDAANADVTVVNVGVQACMPAELTVPAGERTFRIVNQSQRAVEWEILQGVMVVEERENIGPGFAQTLTARLQPGEYEITCGLLSNPRGKLHVTATAGTAGAVKSAPAMIDYIGPLSEYRVYVITQVDALTQDVQSLAEQLKSGDRAHAEAAYLQAHADYSRVAPIADAFGDLDKRLDARADQFEKREQDPAFTGFHRLAYLMTQTPSKTHDAALNEAMARLVDDTKALAARLDDLSVDPQLLAPLAARRLEAIAVNLTQLNEGDDLALRRADARASIAAVLEGTDEITTLLRPMLSTASPALIKDLDADASAARQWIQASPAAEGASTSTALPSLNSAAVSSSLMAYAKDLGRINAALGMN